MTTMTEAKLKELERLSSSWEIWKTDLMFFGAILIGGSKLLLFRSFEVTVEWSVGKLAVGLEAVRAFIYKVRS